MQAEDYVNFSDVVSGLALTQAERSALQAVVDCLPNGGHLNVPGASAAGSQAIHIGVEDNTVVALSIRDAELTALPEAKGPK